MFLESNIRSVVKAFTWRITATIVTTSLVYGYTRSINLAFGVGISEIILKLIFYFAHERIWNLIVWGKQL